MVTISLENYINFVSKLVLGLLYLNLFSLCGFTLSCINYIPTLSFLATIRVHDSIVVLALSLFALSLIPIFIGVHTKIASVLTLDDSVYLIFQETILIVLCITDSLIDESNGLEFNLLDYVHIVISCFLSAICLLYIASIILYFQKLKLSNKERENLSTCKILFVIGTILLIITMIEWHFAHTIYNNWIFNTYLETLFEWTLVTLAIRFPVYLSRVLDYSITIRSQEKIA